MSMKNSMNAIVITGDIEEDIDNDLNCKPCNLSFDKLQTYNLHLQSVSHIQKTLELESHKGVAKMCNDRSICDICGFSFFDEKSYKMHLKDAVHQKRLEMIKEAHIRNEMLEEDAIQDIKVHQQRIANQVRLKLPEEGCEEFNPDANELYCKICEVSCYGIIPFKMHLDGAKHKKKLERHGPRYGHQKNFQKFNEKFDGTMKCDDLDNSIEELIDECREPLIGIEYLVEYDDEDNDVHKYSYLCELCDTKLIINQVIHHLTGLSHRHKYYKIHDPNVYEYLWNLVPRSLKSAKAREFAKKTEEKIGRKSICCVRESPKYEYKIGNEVVKSSSCHSDYKNSSLEQKGYKGLHTKLIEKAIIKYNFDFESDIQAAVLVTNILIEAVLKNKIKMLGKTGKTDEGLENKLRHSKKTKSLLDCSNISDPLLSQAVQEAYKLAKEIVFGDLTLCRVASSFLDSLEKKFIVYMEKGRDRLNEESSCVDILPKKFKFGL